MTTIFNLKNHTFWTIKNLSIYLAIKLTILKIIFLLYFKQILDILRFPKREKVQKIEYQNSLMSFNFSIKF